MELLQNWLRELDRVFSSAREKSEDALDGISKMAAASDLIFNSLQGKFPLFLEFWEKSMRDERMWQETKEPFLKYYSYFSELIKSGIADGSIRDVSESTASRALIGLAMGIILQSLLFPQDADWKGEMQKSMNFLLKGLQNG